MLLSISYTAETYPAVAPCSCDSAGTSQNAGTGRGAEKILIIFKMHFSVSPFMTAPTQVQATSLR